MTKKLNSKISEISLRIIKRSQKDRNNYIESIKKMSLAGKNEALGCSNLAHVTASMSSKEKQLMIQSKNTNLGIISSYNDMLSAHKPYEKYPDWIRQKASEQGVTIQVSGMTPAMCDGITQGREGMELSLFSRDIIAMSVAVSLSHNVYDGVFMLGICDKIVPGLLIGALQFGHLPMLFVPAGPMTSGLSNKVKKEIRQKFALNEISYDELLKAEIDSYHSAGTCTFYGTANSNQMLLESMGLHRPNHAFINPEKPIRKLLTNDSTDHLIDIVKNKNSADYAIGNIIDEKAIVNAIIALLATGGSTNHTIHWIAVAKAASITITWQDIDDLSKIIPLICNIYPNGTEDVNAFQEAGGPACVLNNLLEAGLLHEDVMTINGHGIKQQCQTPLEKKSKIIYQDIDKSLNLNVISEVEKPFKKDGGIKLVTGNLGEAIVKTSALNDDELTIKAKAKVYLNQKDVVTDFNNKKLQEDCVIVVIGQGPVANGMPELHKLMPILSAIKSQDFQVALLTDGRLSGASGQVLSAIHVVPEAAKGGVIGSIQNDDLISIDALNGSFEVHVEASILETRLKHNFIGETSFGRKLSHQLKQNVSPANQGATIW